MKTSQLVRFCLMAAGTLALGTHPLKADLVGPYVPDSNTLFLFHFDEAAGSSAAANSGSKAGAAYSVQNDSTGFGNANPPAVTDLLGASGYSSGPVNFGNAANFHTAGYVIGYDFNVSGAFEPDVQGGPVSPDRLAMTNLNVGLGGQSPFTLEALVAPTNLAGAQEIICTDSYSGGNRGFQFRINGGVLQLQMLDGATFFATTATIPTTGNHAFTNGNWYHAAVAYDGTAVKLYWTRMDPGVTAANQIASQNAVISTGHGNVLAPLVFGNDNRGASGERFSGRIDEIRISKVARGPGEMQFFSPSVTIVANPISQNIDYTEPVRFSVVAASQTAMGFQWRFGGAPISGATSNVYSIAQAAASHAGVYDVVVTNASGFAATSAPATLVVGAANFLAHRYSFAADANDSIGTAHGTNFGNATISDGALVLDGTEGTYTELPGGLLSGLNSVTLDFWATIGPSAGATRVFDFGNSLTNFTGNLSGVNYLYFSPNIGGGHRLTITPGDGSFEQSVAGAAPLTDQAAHVTCVVDPPNLRMLLYTNGVLESVNTNMTAPLSALNNVLSYLGRSLYAVDPYFIGSIDEFRIYNGALSPITVQQNHEQGPNIVLSDGPVDFVINPTNASVPVGQLVTFSAAAVGYLPIRYQWYRNGAPVNDATNATYSFVTVLGDDNSTVQAFATNVIGATTYFDASTAATLDVFVPPTLAWIGAANSDWEFASLNWTNLAGGPLTAYSSFSRALFDSRGEAAPNVNLAAAVNPDQITVNAGTDYMFGSGGNGSLVGQGRIVKQGSGTLVLDVTNQMSGGMLISGGAVQIGNGGTTGTPGTGIITNNAILAFNRGDTVVVPNTISGSGSVQQNGFGVVLSGDNSYSGQTVVNAGTLQVQSTNALGATSSGTVVNAGSQLYITANVDVAAEPLTLFAAGDGSGALRKGGAGLTTFAGPVTLASDATIGVDGGATLTLSNTVSGGALLTKNGSGTLALGAVGTYTGGTVLSEGILQLNGNNALGRGDITVDASASARIVLGPGVTLTNATVFNTVNPSVLNGAIAMADGSNNPVATVTGPITFNADASSGGHFLGPVASGRLEIAGPVTMANGAGILTVRLGNVRFFGTTVHNELQIRAGTTSLGANDALATTASVDIAGNGSATEPASFDLNGFNQTIAGLKTDLGPANVAWVTNGSASLSTLTIEPSGNAFTFAGSILGNISLVLASGWQSLNTNGAALGGLYTYTGNTLINGGTLVLGTGVQLTGTPVIQVADGATLDANAGGLTIGAGQTLRGNGTFNVSGNVTNHGTIELKLSKSGAILGNDRIQGLNHIQLGGTLKLNVTASPALTTNDTFTLFSANSYSGTFAGFNPTRPGPGLSWDQSTLASDGVLRIVTGGGPDTTATNIVATVTGGGTQLELSWPSSHIGWRLQAQTNSLSVGLGSNWADVASSTSTNRITVPVTKSHGAVFYRLIYP